MTFSKFVAGQKLTSADLNERLANWVKFDGDPVTIEGDHNVASISDLGVGDYQINWEDDFANVNYAVCVSATIPGVGPARCNPKTFNTASAVIGTFDGSNSLVDTDRICVIAFGDKT